MPTYTVFPQKFDVYPKHRAAVAWFSGGCFVPSVSATGSRMEILTKENLVGAKTAPTPVSRTFTPLLRETRFP